jgi:SAM-dependent methyltransferase
MVRAGAGVLTRNGGGHAEFDPSSYGAWYRSELGRIVWHHERHVLDRLLGPVAGARILDAGCGMGRFAAELAEAGAEVAGIDGSEAMLRSARAHAHECGINLRLTAADLSALPFPDGSFDRVVAITVLCFARDPEAAVQELARVTRPGGRVVLAELGRWSTWALSRWWGARRKGGLWSETRFWSQGELASLLRGAGLRPLAAESAVFYPPSVHAARLLGSADRWLGRWTSVGAAFIGVSAEKLNSSRCSSSASEC